MSDNDELDLENILGTDSDEDDSGADSEGDQGPDQDGADEKEKKRVDDLMSKWQKAEARANAAEAKLKEKPGADGADGKPANEAGDFQQWLDLAKQQARDSIYASDPRFAAYKLDRGSITGTTPAEMQDAARRMSELLDLVETGVANATLKKHGLSPDVKSAPAQKGKSIADLSDDEFEKLVSRAKAY